MLAPVWRLAGLGAGEDDLLYYLPSRVFFSETVRAGHAPWLNPWVGCDRPFLADPQSAVFYPTTWLFAVTPPLFAYAASLWAHYALAFWGAYRWIRSGRRRPAAAIFGALAFAFCGFMLAHRAHFTMPHAAAWLPIVLWRLDRYVEAGGGRRLGLAALAGALQMFAGHVQIAALTWLGAGAVQLVARRCAKSRAGADAASPTGAGGADSTPASARRTAALILAAEPTRWFALWRLVLVGGAAAGLFAAQWAPTLAYTLICSRVDRGFLDFVENSWSPLSTLGLVAPMVFGQRTPNFFSQPYWGPSHQVEQFAYAGVLPLALAALAIWRGPRGDARRRKDIVLLVVGALTALGMFGPVCPILYWLPGASLFRVPARAMVLAHAALASLAALSIHELSTPRSVSSARLRDAALRLASRPIVVAIAIGMAFCVALLAASAVLPADVASSARRAAALWRPALYVPLALIAVSLVALRTVARRWQTPGALHALTVLTALDLALIGWTIDVPRGVRSAGALLGVSQRQEWLDVVRSRPGRLWVVTARQAGVPGEYVEPQAKGVANINALDHVPALTDYGPLQPSAFQRQFHFKPWGEATQAAALLADTRWMRPFDVAWILVCDPQLPAPDGCPLAHTTARGARLFHNPETLGAAWVERDGPGVEVLARSPSAFSVQLVAPAASEPAQDGTPRSLVVSRLALPGWEARVHGQPLPVAQTADGLLAIELPASSATVEWRYVPPGLAVGVAVSATTGALLLVLGSRDVRRRLLRRLSISAPVTEPRARASATRR